MKKGLFLGVLLCGLTMAAWASDTRPVVRIGITSPVTGNLASIGEDVVAWVGLANKELAAKDTHFRYETFIEDDQLQSRLTLLAVRRLVELNKVNVLLTYGSPPAVATAPYADSVKVPHIGIAFDPRGTAGDYSVSFITPVSGQAPKFVEFLKRKGYRNLAVFYVRNATWQPAMDELHKLDKAGELKIAYEKTYSPGEHDFRLGFQSMPKEGVDAVVILSWSPESNILMRQYREQGLQKPVISLGGSFVLSPQRELFDGCYDIFFGDFTHANEMNQKLMGRALYSSAGPLMYDEILMLSEIYETFAKNHAGKMPTGAEVMAAIKGTKEHDGILGKATFKEDKFFHLDTHWYRIEKENFRVISEAEL